MGNAEQNNRQQVADSIADKTYQPTDYKGSTFVEKGLAKTHEQVSDDYMEGTNDGKIEQAQYAGGSDADIPETGYEGMFEENKH
ncbi:YozQ family protein [Brevibacillus fulvus]|uniref:DUF4025 domain-containing protein n=1 Tax=Brevibacillus fulvus TaxID=1125967 RepID=A0A938Y212_9BACL|nr:YozQ family protein [Brevibacillus fulvus]MBM7589735.1 hypothetical protein [Brevibacillus fulvus]